MADVLLLLFDSGSEQKHPNDGGIQLTARGLT
jgi:hypothetical protein